jgi:hypothetical protein
MFQRGQCSLCRKVTSVILKEERNKEKGPGVDAGDHQRKLGVWKGDHLFRHHAQRFIEKMREGMIVTRGTRGQKYGKVGVW